MKADNYCKSCYTWGHKRSTSRLCPNNRRMKAAIATEADEIELLDSIACDATMEDNQSLKDLLDDE